MTVVYKVKCNHLFHRDSSATPVDPSGTRTIMKKFKTNSRYQGGWGPLGMTGYGEYTFPNGK